MYCVELFLKHENFVLFSNFNDFLLHVLGKSFFPLQKLSTFKDFLIVVIYQKPLKINENKNKKKSVVAFARTHVICILISFIKCFFSFFFFFFFISFFALCDRTMASFLLYHCIMGILHVAGILIFFRRVIWLALSPSLKYFPVRLFYVSVSWCCQNPLEPHKHIS